MATDLLVTAHALSDQELLARLDVLAAKERGATVELLAHLTALDSRPSLYAALGFSSLFAYCRETLHLSEDAACSRIEAARACRRFPLILDLLASGTLSLTSVRLLARHLTAENHRTVLQRASGRSRREIEALLAELAPQPDVPTSVRRLPVPLRPSTPSSPVPAALDATRVPAPPAAVAPPSCPAPLWHPAPRPIVQATAPERYKVQFTIGPETHEKLRRLQVLLRREIPNGDPAVLFDRALSLLLETVGKKKLGARRRPPAAIRPGTDTTSTKVPATLPSRPSKSSSRYMPPELKHRVSQRDGGQCAFVARDGRRCSERTFLEFHHLQPYARHGPTDLDNVSLRCRRHNDYEAELVFGPRERDGSGRIGTSPQQT